MVMGLPAGRWAPCLNRCGGVGEVARAGGPLINPGMHVVCLEKMMRVAFLRGVLLCRIEIDAGKLT